VTELQTKVTDRCLQLHGGYGFMSEYPIAQAFLDFVGANHLRRHDLDHRP
jgi:alkylation response protein AidB-like acyl-CoA dehydrogenase